MSKMSINAFMRTAVHLPVDISILMRGGTGIGKSQLVRQLAKKWGFDPRSTQDGGDVIDRRLAQMSEGDMVGLPSTDGNVTRFNPPDWYKDACLNPRVLFLDELNRATNEVMQSAFQIVLDRVLNGFGLHSKTRVLSAVNIGGEFVVNEMDPALLRRFWTVDLDPTLKDWIKWARSREEDKGGPLNDLIIDFIDLTSSDIGSSYLHPAEKGNMDDVQPTPASWERLNDALVLADIIEKPSNSVFKPMCLGFIGTNASAKFVEYAKSVNTHLTADIIVAQYTEDSELRKNVKKRFSQERWLSSIENVGVWCNKLGKVPETDQLDNIKTFLGDCPSEIRGGFMTKLSDPLKGQEQKENEIDYDHIKRVGKIYSHMKEVMFEAYDLPVEIVKKKPVNKKTTKKKTVK